MATSSSRPEEDCLCPVCRDFYSDPVILLCGHSFCKNCIQEWWTQKGSKTCPVCKEMFSLDRPPRNVALKNVTESLKVEASLKEKASRQTAEDLCETHGERLKLFCVDHQKPICVICRDAKDHKEHKCVPFNEAAEDNKKELRIALMHLKTKLSKFKEEKLTCDKMYAHIQEQTMQTEEKIKGEFQKLYQFLRAEEATRIDGLRKEAEKKHQAMGIRYGNLIAVTSCLSKTVTATETDLETADLSFMLNYEAIKKRARCTLADPETPSGALIDEPQHRGNLLFHVWKKMKSIIQYTPFCLDPNTAKSHIIVSEDLMSLMISNKREEVPSNPERCMWRVDVLGSTGMSSGIHSWDVQLGGYWEVGVITKTKEETRASVFTCGDILVQHAENQESQIAFDNSPKRIRLKFEQDKGKLLFYDLDTRKDIHTITGKFTGLYFPFFSGDVKLIPGQPPLV